MTPAIVQSTSTLPFQVLFKDSALKVLDGDFVGACLRLGARNLGSAQVGEFSGMMNTAAFDTEPEMFEFLAKFRQVLTQDDVVMFKLV